MAFLYPLNVDLQKIGPEKVARMSANRVGFQIMPMRRVNAGIIQWEQMDNYFGLQQMRGLDGAPLHVKQVGSRLFSFNPGVYGEFSTIGETELTLRSGSIVGEAPVDVSDLVLAKQDQLIQRELDRIEQIIWTLVSSGTFSVSTGQGVAYTDTFTLQTASAAVAWGTVATATPLVDFRTVQLLGPGKGVSFGAGSKAYMNRTTANKLLANTNASDLFGRRQASGATFNSISDINRILLDQDVPEIVIYDEGYYNDSNVFTRYIADNKVVIVGNRPNGVIGEYQLTRNMNNPGGTPGSYEYVIDRTKPLNGERQTPPNIEVHRGHNGGPAIYFPGSIVILTVS